MDRKRLDGAEHISGFTLLEVLVVLALVAALGTLVIPATAERLAALRTSSAVEAAETALARISLRAALDGEPWVIDSSGVRMARESPASATVKSDAGLPAGWRVTADPAITIHSDGFCEGGRIVVRGPNDERRDVQVERGGCAAKQP